MGSDDDDDDEEDDDDDSEEDDESDADEFARPSNVVIEEILDGQADDGQITAMTAAKVQLCPCILHMCRSTPGWSTPLRSTNHFHSDPQLFTSRMQNMSLARKLLNVTSWWPLAKA